MTEQKIESALHIPRSFDYHRELAARLRATYKDHLFRFEESAYPNGMPLDLVDKVPHVVMLSLMAGDDWERSLIDMNLAEAMTQNKAAIGPNVNTLGVFKPFDDQRQDKPSWKAVPGSPNEVATVESQSSWTMLMAKVMKYVAGVDYLVQLEGHSHLATTHFNEVGIEVINLTASSLIIEELETRGLLKGNYENVICGVDFGNLTLTSEIAKKHKLGLAVIRKWRETVDGKAETVTRNELVYGDVKGKRVILMDDMIDGGGTIVDTVDLLLKNGAAEILVCATHAVFGKPSYYGLMQRLLKNDRVKIVMTTNSLPEERPARGGDKSTPYIPVNGTGEPLRRKEVQKLDIIPFIEKTVGVLLDSGGDTNEIRRKLADHILVQRDPYEVYKEITGKTLKPPEITKIYGQGGFFRDLPEAQTETEVLPAR